MSQGSSRARWALAGGLALFGSVLVVPVAQSAEVVPQPPSCKDVKRSVDDPVLEDGIPIAPYDNGGTLRQATQYWIKLIPMSQKDGVKPIGGVPTVVHDGSWQNGGTDAQVIVGSPFVDTITAGSNNDVICGGGGADSLSAGQGHDVVWAGKFSPGGTYSFADTCPGANKTIDGNDGNDFLVAGRCNDTVTAGNGDDIVDDKGGNDNIDGSSGADKINGDDGDDVIHGRAQADDINAGRGNDIVHGGTEDDIIVGDHPSRCCNGDDRIDVPSAIDSSGGDAGNDIIAGTWRRFFPSQNQLDEFDNDTCGITTKGGQSDTLDGDVDRGPGTSYPLASQPEQISFDPDPEVFLPGLPTCENIQ